MIYPTSVTYLVESFRFKMLDSDMDNIFNYGKASDCSTDERTSQVAFVLLQKKIDNSLKDKPSFLGPNIFIYWQ